MTQLLSHRRTNPPPLENGDNLTTAEFLRRYEAQPDVKKAELIEGVVYMASPVTLEGHGSQHADLAAWLGVYRAFTPGVLVGDNATVLLDPANAPQPDLCLLIRSGTTHVVDGYIAGAPELVAEISATSASIDLHQKKELYARFGVREYIVWRTHDSAIDWFRLDKDIRLIADQAGVVRSDCFPGLWLAVPQLLSGDLPLVHEVLKRGLSDPSHAEFVQSLGG